MALMMDIKQLDIHADMGYRVVSVLSNVPTAKERAWITTGMATFALAQVVNGETR